MSSTAFWASGSSLINPITQNPNLKPSNPKPESRKPMAFVKGVGAGRRFGLRPLVETVRVSRSFRRLGF